ncbi:MAG: relaxase MobL [Lachnospiraceae bacterium]|nr:relaxase MobL [Ruminococcus sp.]MCM1276667.1 relaxase MobL [Lachnospiraceae bacterium]
MPKLIVTSRYIKPNAHGNFGNYIKYIATREGVEKPVQKQEQHQELDREIFMNYLNSRPNSHGLFSETDEPIVLDKVAKAVAEHGGALWTHIVSLKREDAERMGYIDLDHWRDLVRRHISDIAAAQKIAPENIRWYAAFHNKESNPHVHIVVYSENPREGYLTKDGIEKIRSAFANDIYKDELQNLYQQQTAVRDKLRSEAESVMKNLLFELQNGSFDDSQLEQLVFKLQKQLRNSKSKKVYGYLQPNVKKTVDQIVSLLAQNPVLKKVYDEWCKLEQQKYETYTSAVQKFPPLEENKVFKPIKNAVIRAVMEMDFSTEMFAEYNEDEIGEAESDKKLYIKWTTEYKSACYELYKNHDVPKAFELLRDEAKKGNVHAVFDIGKMYRNGLLGEENIPKADEYFQKAYDGFQKIAAENPDEKILYRLGVMTFSGIGCDTDRDLGVEYIKQSAELGNKYAQAFLENVDRYKSVTTRNAIMSMLFSLGRLISDDYNRNLHGQRIRTEHKLKAAIRRKKQALGLKENPLENPQFK